MKIVVFSELLWQGLILAVIMSAFRGAVVLVPGLILGIGLLVYAAKKYDKAEEAVREAIEEAAKTRPGFKEFYRKYKQIKAEGDTARSREMLLGLLGDMVGGATVGLFHGAHKGAEIAMEPLDTSEARYTRIRNSLHEIYKQ